MNKRGKVTPSNPSPNSFMQHSERKPSTTRSPRGKSPSGRMTRWPCKDYFRGSEKWHPPECLYYQTKSGCRFGEKCSCAHSQVDEQPSKRSKKNDDKSAVAVLKKYTTIGLRFPGYGAAEVFMNLAEEHRNAQTNPTSNIHESHCTSRKNSRPKSLARLHLSR